jgi:hypothetical protein
VPPRPADGNWIAAQLGIISRQRRLREQLLMGTSPARTFPYSCWTRYELRGSEYIVQMLHPGAARPDRILLVRGNMR